MIILKRNNTAIGLSFKLMSINKKPVILDNCDVNFILVNKNKEVLIKRKAQIVDAYNGLINFFFTINELNTYGEMDAELELLYYDGSKETFPKSGTIPIIIKSSLN